MHSSSLATALSRLRKKPITCCGHEGDDPCLPLCPHFAPFSFICYPDLVVSLCLKAPRALLLPAYDPCWVSSHSWVLFLHSSPLASASPCQKRHSRPPRWRETFPFSSVFHLALTLLQHYTWQKKMKGGGGYSSHSSGIQSKACRLEDEAVGHIASMIKKQKAVSTSKRCAGSHLFYAV